MEWHITKHTDPAFLEVVTKGTADNFGSMEMAKEIAYTMRKHQFRRALIDHRNIEKISGSVLDVIERPKLFRIIGIILGIKLAAVINPAHAEHFKFLETVCRNQGYKYSVFYDRSNALQWLTE